MMLRARASTQTGEQMARALARAWRHGLSPLDLSAAELELIAPLLLGSGAASLIWAKLRLSAWPDQRVMREFQQAYRLHTVQAALHEVEIQEVITLFRAAGIEPMLIKGWTVARFYPEPGLRPYGDIDLCIRPEQYQAAVTLMRGPTGQSYNVDLHRGFEQVDDQPFDRLFARAELLPIGEVEVRALSQADQLRTLCTHLLKHGAWRPLWLCDIAAIVEALPADFDWATCLGEDRRQAEWVACSIGLARDLLGAQIDRAPASVQTRSLPRWLVPAVLKQWQWSRAIEHTPPELMIDSLHHPTRLAKAFYERWPNPVRATFNLQAPFNNLPRLPFQVGDCIAQLAGFLTRLPRQRREPS
jgi:hypothetical protein